MAKYTIIFRKGDEKMQMSYDAVIKYFFEERDFEALKKLRDTIDKFEELVYSNNPNDKYSIVLPTEEEEEW